MNDKPINPKKVVRALARLERQLEAKDAKIAALRAELEGWEGDEAWRWTRHRVVEKDPSPSLPIPRLEIRYEAIDEAGYNTRALYCLVYRHYTHKTGGLACDKSTDCIVFVPIGETRMGGPASLEPREREGRWAGRSYGPYRDGAHIRHDMKQMGLPGFIIGASGDAYQIDLAAEAELK